MPRPPRNRTGSPRPAGPYKHGAIPVIGLIGAIGAGKSRVAALLAAVGCLRHRRRRGGSRPARSASGARSGRGAVWLRDPRSSRVRPTSRRGSTVAPWGRSFSPIRRPCGNSRRSSIRGCGGRSNAPSPARCAGAELGPSCSTRRSCSRRDGIPFATGSSSSMPPASSGSPGWRRLGAGARRRSPARGGPVAARAQACLGRRGDRQRLRHRTARGTRTPPRRRDSFPLSPRIRPLLRRRCEAARTTRCGRLRSGSAGRCALEALSSAAAVAPGGEFSA